jgi:hypothetical protein
MFLILTSCAALNDTYKPTDIRYVSLPEGIPEWAKNLYKTARIGEYCPGQFSEDEEHNLVYKVTLMNGRGVVVERFYHKTHMFAFTTKEPGKDIYTTIADKKMNIFSVVKPGEFKYSTYDTSHWTIKHPEPDDFNPYEHDPKYRHVIKWRKACEWWPDDTP